MHRASRNRVERRTRALVAIGCASAAALVLAGCGAATGSSAGPTWVPSPGFGSNGEGPGVHVTPIIPVPSLSSVPAAPGGAPSAPTQSPSAPRQDPNVVAKHLDSPTGLTLLPDGSALVGERRTGRIVRVQPEAGQPVPTVRRIDGLDTDGGGGLLDLAVSPTYTQDSLIYAYVSTEHDNRVIDFTLHGKASPVLTGVPRGGDDNTGRIAFDARGDLFIGTGDAGRPALASAPHSLAGKVLRVNSIGDRAAGDPHPGSPVWTSGHRVVDGLCPVPQTTAVLEVESASGGHHDEVNLLTAGADYGWPKPSASGHGPVATAPKGFADPGGCAVLDGRLWMTSLTGQALLSAPLTAKGSSIGVGAFSPVLKGRYGRLRTVVAAQDGALWLTTSNKDGHGHPVAADERVIRYQPQSNSAGNPPV